MRHRRPLLSIVFAVSLVALSASMAFAGNPHFKTAAATLGSPRLIITGIEVGLGSGATVVYEASADVSGTAQCVNGGKQNPSASNKSFSGQLDATATAQADANGKITAEIVLPALPPDFCPTGQVAVVVTATFTNVTLTDTTNGITVSIPGTFVYTAP